MLKDFFIQYTIAIYVILKYYTDKIVHHSHSERKNILKMNKVGMLLQKRANTSGVGISNMRKSI